MLPEQALNGVTTEELERRFQAAGIDLHLMESVSQKLEMDQLRPLRADLLETTFVARRN